MDFRLDHAQEILNRTPATLKTLLRGLPDEWVIPNEGPDSWSPFDVMGHLVHGEKTDWIPRARIILEHGEGRDFEPFDTAVDAAEEAREQRRVKSHYEDDLGEWLDVGRFAMVVYDDGLPVTFTPDETTRREIARWFLKLERPEQWKDRSLQMQIGAALKALGWEVRQTWRRGRNINVWHKTPP